MVKKVIAIVALTTGILAASLSRRSRDLATSSA
jgi:hypothetical protein